MQYRCALRQLDHARFAASRPLPPLLLAVSQRLISAWDTARCRRAACLSPRTARHPRAVAYPTQKVIFPAVVTYRGLGLLGLGVDAHVCAAPALGGRR